MKEKRPLLSNRKARVFIPLATLLFIAGLAFLAVYALEPLIARLLLLIKILPS